MTGGGGGMLMSRVIRFEEQGESTSMLKRDVKSNKQAKTYIMYKYNMYMHLQHKLEQ